MKKKSFLLLSLFSVSIQSFGSDKDVNCHAVGKYIAEKTTKLAYEYSGSTNPSNMEGFSLVAESYCKIGAGFPGGKSGKYLLDQLVNTLEIENTSGPLVTYASIQGAIAGFQLAEMKNKKTH